MGSRNTDGSPIIVDDTRVYHKGSRLDLVTTSGVDTTQALADHSIEFAKFIDGSGNLEHVVTRGMGIHTSVSMRAVAASGTSLGHMRTKTERKVFYVDGDRNLTPANQGDWTIYDAGGIPVGEAAGTSDTDVTPHDT